MRTIFTIGYEGSEVESFLFTLGAAGIDRIIDVRDVPLSRKRGFSKSALAASLSTAGIAYTHLKALGDPKEGRLAMRRGDKRSFLEIFGMQLQTPEAGEALEQTAMFARREKVALLCYERDPQDCHRSLVAAELSRDGEFKVFHLGVRKMSDHKCRRVDFQAAT